MSHKIFGAFLFMALAAVVLMTSLTRYFAGRNFEEYVFKRDMSILQSFALKMADYYESHGNWQEFSNNPKQFNDFFRESQFGFMPAWKDRRPFPEPADRMGELSLPDPPEPREPREPDNKPSGGPPDHMGGPIMPPWPPGPEPPGPKFPGIEKRIALFKANQTFVAGEDEDFGSLETIPITLNESTVGWLGLKKAGGLRHPLDLEFISNQNRVYLIIGASILLVGVFIALMLSHQILSPIRRLAKGTRALSARKFEYKIRVDTSDELGRLAEDFNKMAANLGEYETRQKQWLSDVSHELRTPLSILIGEIEALQDGIREPDEAALASLHQEAARLSKIVQDLRALSLAESGGLIMKDEPIDLKVLLEETAQRFKVRFNSEGIQTVLETNGAPAAFVLGDRDWLAQVFSNLLENVSRHAQKPGVLTIRLDKAKQNGWVAASVKDSGPGVPEECLPFLFDRLYRVDSARSRVTGGSGLGLSICRSIVEKHGGVISAANSDRGGLIITIELPTTAIKQ